MYPWEIVDGLIGLVGLKRSSQTLQIISDWGCNGQRDSDSNHDKTVDTDDILLIIQNWAL